ncbi:MAG: DUF2202 domain-containing protein [Campylobacterota bacterium]|nr:DUF2202 domain-containing protein [Campylobacterota bacterium]
MEVNFDEDLLEGLRVNPNFDEPILNQVLRIALYDEFHAYEVYKKVMDTFGQVDPFINIIAAEQRHIDAVYALCTRYGVEPPVDNWYDKIELPATLLECCEVGVAAEIDNVKMYDDLLKYTQEYADITDVLYRLQAASYNNHLPAFRRCVAQYSGYLPEDKNINSNNNDAMEQKVDEFRNIAQKLSTGQLSQQDIAKVVSSMDISTVGGVLLGGLGVVQFINTMNKKDS